MDRPRRRRAHCTHDHNGQSPDSATILPIDVEHNARFTSKDGFDCCSRRRDATPANRIRGTGSLQRFQSITGCGVRDPGVRDPGVCRSIRYARAEKPRGLHRTIRYRTCRTCPISGETRGHAAVGLSNTSRPLSIASRLAENPDRGLALPFLCGFFLLGFLGCPRAL